MDRQILIKNLLTYYRQDLSSLTLYMAGLNDLPDEILQPVLAECVQTMTFMPRIAEIRKMAVALKVQIERRPVEVTLDGQERLEIVRVLMIEYDNALGGHFDRERFLRLILQLRRVDSTELSDSWRRRYDHFTGEKVIDRYALAADWPVQDSPQFIPESMRSQA